jgi:spore germination protein YaaH
MKLKHFIQAHVLLVLFMYAIFLSGITYLLHKSGTFKTIGTGVYVLDPAVDNKYQIKPIDTLSYGFLPYWSVGDFNTNDLNNLTDIAYFSLFLNDNGSIDTNNNHYTVWKSSQSLYSIVSKAKKQGVRLSITVSIHDNEKIENFLYCGEICWARSLAAINNEIEQSGFKGLNFDFENVGDTDPRLSTAYADYVSYISKHLKDKYEDKFLIVVSTYGDSVEKRRITDISKLNNSDVDYLFIMAYDFFRPNSNIAGPVAPLTGAQTDYHYDVTTMTKDYLTQIDASKLILGIPLYGLNFIVEEPRPYATRIPGNDFIDYSIQQNLGAVKGVATRENANIEWDEQSNTPYFTYYKPAEGVHRIVFFENDQSIDLKKKFASDNFFAGVGYWALGYE